MISKIKKHVLDYNSAYNYFIEILDKVNVLSSCIVKNLDFSTGSFFTLLPDSLDFESHIHSFKCGYTESSLPLKNHIRHFIFRIISANTHLACVFDDFLSNYHSNYKEDLFLSNGKFLNEEIYYYFTKNNISLQKIETALRYSDQIWHSLAVIYEAKVPIINKKLMPRDCEDMCKNAVIMAVTAYDGQGYIFWKKHGFLVSEEEEL